MRAVLPSLLLCGAFLASHHVEAKVHAVVTEPALAELTLAIGGDHVTVATVSPAGAAPEQVDALARAHLLIAAGSDGERSWLLPLQRAAGNRAITAEGGGFLDCSQFVTAADASLPTAIHARAIGGKLAQIDPDHADHYEAGVLRVVASLLATG